MSGSCCRAIVVLQVERPGTVAAGAVSILAVIGILVVSTGSIIRSNQSNRSGTSGGGTGTSGGGTGTSGGGTVTSGGGSGTSGGGSGGSSGGGPGGSSSAGSRGLPGMVRSIAKCHFYHGQICRAISFLTLVSVQATRGRFFTFGHV